MPAVRQRGLTLIELLVALALASFLVIGLVQMVSAATAADSLQRNQAQIMDGARFVAGILGRAVRQAGFRPEPWNDAYAAGALGGDTLDGTTAASDRLHVRRWSDRNCFGAMNPDRDADGQPQFYLLESTFEVNSGGSLAHTCRYGPDPASLTTQIRRNGLVPGVESFQLLFGEDADGDGNANAWVRAGQWTDVRRVLGVRIGLLLASENAVSLRGAAEYVVLDEALRPPADGRLRRAFEFAVAIRGRAG